MLAGVLCLACLSGIAGLFWLQDLQYSRPTPVPSSWVDVPAGARVALPRSVALLREASGSRPVLLHFFNPGCPCSRFNVDHVRTLARTFGDRVTFVAVLTEDDPQVLETAYRQLGLDLPHIVDDGTLARAVGAYSTPQAALVGADDRLVYRGNYNLTRYCRDRDTEFVRLALEHLLSGGARPAFPTAATTSYGCPLRSPLGVRAEGS